MSDTTDFLIVGSGIAGLRAAIALGSAGRVLVLTKADPAESNTGYAQGGIAAAVGEDDSPALHAADTPYVVNNAGFIPVAVVGTESGAHGNHLVLAVAAESKIETIKPMRTPLMMPNRSIRIPPTMGATMIGNRLMTD